MLVRPTIDSGCSSRFLRWAFLPIALSVTGLSAQVPTTVQLPTFRQFSTNSSVLVPDQGSASLGGVNSFQSGSSSSGVPVLGRLPGIGRAFNNRAFGANTNSSQVRVHATIIDLEEMDAALRGTEAAVSYTHLTLPTICSV